MPESKRQDRTGVSGSCAELRQLCELLPDNGFDTCEDFGRRQFSQPHSKVSVPP